MKPTRPMNRTIKQEWLRYMDRVIPKEAAPVQIHECKRAFVAGAASVMRLLLELGDDSVSEDAGVDVIERLQKECRDFVADVNAGRA